MLRRSAQALLPRLLQGQGQGGMGCLAALNHVPSWNLEEERPSASAAAWQPVWLARCKFFHRGLATLKPFDRGALP